MNIYFICIDKDIVNDSDADIVLQGITEYISLMFAGKFQDSRLREHDYAFDDVVAMYGKELTEMSSYISEVAEEREQRHVKKAVKKVVKKQKTYYIKHV